MVGFNERACAINPQIVLFLTQNLRFQSPRHRCFFSSRFSNGREAPLSHSKGKTYEMRVPKSSVVCVALLLLLATAQEARAYTDPGSGALIWQMLAAGFVGVVFYFRRIWSWVRTKMRGSAE